MTAAAPFAPGSVSLRLYPHLDLPAPTIVEELRAQARTAEAAGFAGVMVSEHHGGFAGYLPNPLQAAGFLLDATERMWVAACPILLPLRPAALVAEETAWLAARHPARVGLGVASGALPLDFEVMDLDATDAAARFKAALPRVVAMLRGEALGALADDPALRRCATEPVPVLSAAVSPTAARRSAAVGAGILLDSMTEPARQRVLCDEFEAAGGAAPRVAIRRVWLGSAPTAAFAAQRSRYEGYTPAAAQERWVEGGTLVADEPADLAALLDASVRQVRADAVNLRVHVPGVPPEVVREQIERLAPVVARLSV